MEIVSCFNAVVTKNTHGASSNLFALCRELSDFVPRASSALRSFPTYLALNFPHFLDARGKRLKFQINMQPGFKKFLSGLLDLSFYWVTNTHLFFRFSNASFLSWM